MGVQDNEGVNKELKAGFHMITDDRRSETIADDRKEGCFHIIATIAEPTVEIRFGQQK